MSEQDFSNREITAMFDFIKQELREIKEQTIKTNGRVTKLEVKTEGIAVKVMTWAGLAGTAVAVLINKIT